MNWCKMVSSGLVQPGSEIKIVYSGCCVDVCVIQKDGKVIDKKTGEVHDRPSQLWSKNKHARKISWWDVCVINGLTLRSIKNGGLSLRSPISRVRGVSVSKQSSLQTTLTPPPKKLKRKPYQTSLRAAGNPHSKAKRALQPEDAGASKKATSPLTPRYWTPVTANVDSRIDFAREYFGSRILSYDKDEKGFVCKCGKHLDLTNPNFENNVRLHYDKKCSAASRAGVTAITRFFAPVKKYARPDPQIFCHGIWQESVLIDGVQCRTELLGEYSNSLLYYVSARPILLTGRFGEVRTAKRSIFSVDCLTHALDQHNRIRKPKLCQRCTDLLENQAFRKLLKDAQDPTRWDPSSRVPTQYLSWVHLQEQKRQTRKRNMLDNWHEHNRKRAADRRMARRLAKATENFRAGELYVIYNIHIYVIHIIHLS